MPQVLYQGDSPKIWPVCCLAKIAVTDTERYIFSISPYIWHSRWHYCFILPGISRTGRWKGEKGKNGCCLPSNTGIIMTSQGTVIAKYYHSSDYKLNETILLMLYSQWWLSRWLLSSSYFFLYLFIAKEQRGELAQCLESNSENGPWKIANFLKTNNLSTMSSQTLIFQEQKPSMNCSLCTLHKKKVSQRL